MKSVMDWHNGIWNYIRNFLIRTGYKYFSAIYNSRMVLLPRVSREIQFSFWINTRGDPPGTFCYLGINVMVHEKMLPDSQAAHVLHLLLAFGFIPSTSYLLLLKCRQKTHTHTLQELSTRKSHHFWMLCQHGRVTLLCLQQAEMGGLYSDIAHLRVW